MSSGLFHCLCCVERTSCRRRRTNFNKDASTVKPEKDYLSKCSLKQYFEYFYLSKIFEYSFQAWLHVLPDLKTLFKLPSDVMKPRPAASGGKVSKSTTSFLPSLPAPPCLLPVAGNCDAYSRGRVSRA